MRLTTSKVQAPGSDSPVTVLELFFDLVFVFLVTQLTGLITTSHGWVGYGQAALVLAVTWWMYDGFAWLANNVAPDSTGTRLPMLLAMACFLAMAVVVPEVFGAGAWVFAAAYLVVVTIHAVQFSRSSLGRSAEAIRAVLPVNYGMAALLFVAAALGDWGWTAWVGAVVLPVASVLRRQESALSLRIEHLAERHSLLVIIALGETVVAIGVGAQGSLRHAQVLAAAALAVTLISALWWVYFAVGDDARGPLAVLALPESDRTAAAFRPYSAAHLLHVGGLVLVAAGLHPVVHEPGHRLTWRLALTLSAGVAGFLCGQAAFRSSLRLASATPHLVTAVGVLLLCPLGAVLSGGAQLGLVTAAVVLLAVVLQRQVRAPELTGV